MAATTDFQSFVGLRGQLTPIPRHSNKCSVIREAPKVCPAPIRTNEKQNIDGPRKKSTISRVKSLTRPTISSLAKTRAKLSTSNKENIVCEKTRRNTKTTNRISSQVAKHKVQSIASMRGEYHPNKKSLHCQQFFEDLSSDINSASGYSDKIGVNPLLIDADDFMFEAYSDETETPCSASCCSEFDSCDTPQSITSFTSLFNIPSSCALSFAAGFGVGMALGTCSFLRHPLST